MPMSQLRDGHGEDLGSRRITKCKCAKVGAGSPLEGFTYKSDVIRLLFRTKLHHSEHPNIEEAKGT